MTYAQARLRLGMAAVGTIVVLSAILFVYQLPSTFFPFYGGPWYADWAALIVFYLGYALVSMPFDLAGGYWLPCQHHRICLPLPVFLWKWVRGVAVQGFFMTLAGLAILESAQRAGYWGAVAAVAIIQFFLLLFQTRIALLVGGLAPSSSEHAQKSGALALDSLDPGFSGGFAGLPGLERLILPGHWLRALSPEALDVELKRRAGLLATGTRLRGVLLAAAWNLAGFMLCGALPRVDLGTIFGLLEAVLGCTLWSFLGLLILPSLSRPGVLEADRWAIDHGATEASLLLAMTEIDRFQEDEPSRPRWVERIFHPIPSIENRLKALESPRRPTGAWQAARMALYLSWANFGLLSRAVHCNSGRPDLWVIPPGD